MYVQVVRHERASIKADIWSYGILIWELISGQDITELQPLAIARQQQRKVLTSCPMGSAIHKETTSCLPSISCRASSVQESGLQPHACIMHAIQSEQGAPQSSLPRSVRACSWDAGGMQTQPLQHPSNADTLCGSRGAMLTGPLWSCPPWRPPSLPTSS